MADTYTPVLNLTKPEIDGSAETWGQKLNGDLDILDANAGWVVGQLGGIDARIIALINAVIPFGTIIAWWGQLPVPAGWQLCDGTGNTPNLVNRFILGSNGSTIPVGQAGGQFSSTVGTSADGQHAHGGTTQGTALSDLQMPYHMHGGRTNTGGGHTHIGEVYGIFFGEGTGGHHFTSGSGPTPFQQSEYWGMGDHEHGLATDWRGGDQPHSHGMWPDGNHAHTVSMNTTPPYMAVMYLMKVT